MLHVKCPMCNGLLTINPKTRRVIRHVSAADLEKSAVDRFDTIRENIEKSRSEQAQRLEEAKAREAARQKRLDDLFAQAKDKARENPDEGRPLGPIWD